MKKGALVIILSFLLVAGIVFSQEEVNKVDNEVEELLQEQDEVSVIVVLEDDESVLDGYSATAMDEFDKKKMMVAEQQEEVLSNLDSEQDLEVGSKFSTVNGFSGNVTKEGLEKLKADKNVKKVYPNRPVRAFLSDSKYIVNASRTWSLIYNSTNLTGKREVVCVIDTGVNYTHPNMGNCAATSNINDGSCAKVIGGYDFINDDQDPSDDNGHGTHVAGIVASTNDTYRGIAPDANIVAIKSLGSGGSGTTQNVVDGIDWCVNNASILNISIISMSLGTTTLFSANCDDSDPLTAAAIDAAIAKNISVIAATGNEASATSIASPACIKNSTSVGWTNKDDTINSNSNRNNITDLLAPGSSITSLANSGGITSLSGTSMSTPHVAGAFALLHQYLKLIEGRNATPAEIQDVLNSTGKQIDDTSNSGFFFSRINIFAAITFLDTEAPVITITNPENGTAKKNISFVVNITSNEVLNNATLEINNTNFTMEGSGTEWNLNISSLIDSNYSYKVYGNDTFGNAGISETFSITIGNSIPVATNITINSTDLLNRTNGTLQGFFTFTDSDDDTITSNETKWYNNSKEVLELANHTLITSNYTKKNQNWTFSVRVSDGINFSDWVNSTNLTIINSDPKINITIQNITVNESDLVDINLSGNLGATDNDNDTLIFSYSSPLNTTGQFQTSFTDARNYTITINISDGTGFDSQQILIEVLDKVNGANDTIKGNITDIKTNAQSLGLRINNTLFNSSKTILGVQEINLTDGDITLAVFDFNFTNLTKFNFVDMKINRTNVGGAESLVISGIDLTSQNSKKTLYLNKTDTSLNSVCVKDAEISSIDDLSSDCSNSDETKLACDGIATDGFTCTLENGLYKITSLSHSGIKQISFTRPSESSSSSSSSGGGSSGGGGGGGGGGSGLSYTCNMDWECGEWSECDGSWQTRECNFVKVAQHTQSTACSAISNAPQMAVKCKLPSVSALEPTAQENIQKESRPLIPTGAVVAEAGNANLPTGIIIISSIIIIGIVAYTVFLRRK